MRTLRNHWLCVLILGNCVSVQSLSALGPQHQTSQQGAAAAVSSRPLPVSRIEICQNKDCCRNFNLKSTTLPQVVRDLLAPEDAARIEIETTSCLSQCEKGPNMRITSTVKKEQNFLHGVSDQIVLAALLDTLELPVPPKFLAACTVLDKVYLASQPEEKERFVSSVIRSLDNDETYQNGSSIHGRALATRAELYLEASRLDEALTDAQRVLQQQMPASLETQRKAYRVSVDVHEQQKRFREAVECLQQWAAVDPAFRSKINKEIQELQQKV